MRAVLMMMVIFSSSCGLLIDGAYLLSGKHSYKDVEQRRPTGEAQTGPECRLTFENSRVRVACEEVTRGVDRVWSVHKTYENQGGWYQAHWVPVILEGLIGGGLAIGLGARCTDPSSTSAATSSTAPFLLRSTSPTRSCVC